jgi:perosamine synthetase
MIPVSEPLLGGNEKKYLSECIDTGWISSEGPFVNRFESLFSSRVRRQYGIAVCNGSAALDVAVNALEIKTGDEVILPAFSIISCAACIVRAGATPVLVDCDPITWNMTAEEILPKITNKTKAILVVHIYGLPVDMDPILALAKQNNIMVIEDAAEMHGQTYNGRPCGSFGDISTFSFYSNKNITTGEGGIVVVDDPKLAKRCRSLRNLCFKQEKRFVHDELGWNFRMSNLQAAIGVAQIERLEEFVQLKRHMGKRYSEMLADIEGLQLPKNRTDYAENIYWVYGIVLKDEIPFDASEAMKRLRNKGIGTRPFFWPMHEQPFFKKMELFVGESYPVAERIARRGFYIPSGLALSDSQMEQVAIALHEVMN